MVIVQSPDITSAQSQKAVTAGWLCRNYTFLVHNNFDDRHHKLHSGLNSILTKYECVLALQSNRTVTVNKTLLSSHRSVLKGFIVKVSDFDI